LWGHLTDTPLHPAALFHHDRQVLSGLGATISPGEYVVIARTLHNKIVTFQGGVQMTESGRIGVKAVSTVIAAVIVLTVFLALASAIYTGLLQLGNESRQPC
jgi:hypothetical protein